MSSWLKKHPTYYHRRTVKWHDCWRLRCSRKVSKCTPTKECRASLPTEPANPSVSLSTAALVSKLTPLCYASAFDLNRHWPASVGSPQMLAVSSLSTSSCRLTTKTCTLSAMPSKLQTLCSLRNAQRFSWEMLPTCKLALQQITLCWANPFPTKGLSEQQSSVCSIKC
eukprot:PhF_6_TR42793/c0_g1_i1/m.64750